jgi:RNA polymerase sigma factor (sigma-70 family)
MQKIMTQALFHLSQGTSTRLVQGADEGSSPLSWIPPSLETPAISEDEQLALLIDKMVGHDEKALSRLYEVTLSRVFGLTLRIVRSRTLAEEVVEETYFQAWRQAVRFDPRKGKAITWLLNMARSRAIDAIRKEEKFEHGELQRDELEGLVVQSGILADELLDIARNSQRIREALLALGAQPRQLVALAFFRGLSHEEISQHMMLPLGTVKTQIRRALASLKVTLSDLAPQGFDGQAHSSTSLSMQNFGSQTMSPE